MNKIKIKQIIEVKYVKGKCFICGESCGLEGYAHYACAIAFTDDKLKKAKEFYEKKYS